jgi:hypothetical protein
LREMPAHLQNCLIVRFFVASRTSVRSAPALSSRRNTSESMLVTAVVPKDRRLAWMMKTTYPLCQKPEVGNAPWSVKRREVSRKSASGQQVFSGALPAALCRPSSGDSNVLCNQYSLLQTGTQAKNAGARCFTLSS